MQTGFRSTWPEYNVRELKFEHYDYAGNLVSLFAPIPPMTLTPRVHCPLKNWNALSWASNTISALHADRRARTASGCGTAACAPQPSPKACTLPMSSSTSWPASALWKRRARQGNVDHSYPPVVCAAISFCWCCWPQWQERVLWASGTFHRRTSHHIHDGGAHADHHPPTR